MSRQARLEGLLQRAFDAIGAGDIETASRRYDEAARINPQHEDVRLLEAKLRYAYGDFDRSLALFESLLETELELEAHLGAADVLLEQGEHGAAALHLERVIPELEPDERGDFLHDLGICREEVGDRTGMIEAFLEVRKLDRAAPLQPWHLDVDAFEVVAAKALAELPDDVQKRLSNVPILIDDVPSEGLVREGIDPRILGLFSGTPMAEILSVGGAPQLTTIHLYWRNLERSVASAEELAEEIRITVLHETAHFFGLDDDDLAERGLD